MDMESMRCKAGVRQGDTPEQAPGLSIRRIETPEAFTQWADGIAALLNLYQSKLLDDFSNPDPVSLLENTATYIPWLWLLVADGSGKNRLNGNEIEDSQALEPAMSVLALACLDNITPERHAWIHGISHPAIRRHPGIDILAKTAIYAAFSPPLSVAKLKAEFEASNRGARGFCLRHGFTREARFARDNRLNGVWQDVLVYSLFREGGE